MRVDIIIPCFNEEDVLPESYRRFTSALEGREFDFSLIFINDGSSDRTLEILRELASKDKRVRVLSFSRNFGHQNAVTAGLHNTDSDVAIIIDADLQDPPEVIPDMIKLWQEKNADMIYAVRLSRDGETYLKKQTSKMFYRILNSMSETSFPVDTGDFRLIDRAMIDTFRRFPEKHKYLRGLFCWMGYKHEPFYYNRDERFAGETKYSITKMIRLAGYGVFGFSKKPLKLAISFGSLCILIALFVIIRIMILNIFYPERFIQGWSSTIFVVLLMGGIQLFTIGILGEYIGNIFDETKNRPEYIISEKLNFDENHF